MSAADSGRTVKIHPGPVRNESAIDRTVLRAVWIADRILKGTLPVQGAIDAGAALWAACAAKGDRPTVVKRIALVMRNRNAVQRAVVARHTALFSLRSLIAATVAINHLFGAITAAAVVQVAALACANDHIITGVAIDTRTADHTSLRFFPGAATAVVIGDGLESGQGFRHATTLPGID